MGRPPRGDRQSSSRRARARAANQAASMSAAANGPGPELCTEGPSAQPDAAPDAGEFRPSPALPELGPARPPVLLSPPRPLPPPLVAPPLLKELARKNSGAELLSFLGAGMYAHHIPP